jgi:co-chaperonin GroES (HSP10)
VGSIVLTENDGYLHGEVLAIGAGQAAVNGVRMPMDVAVGDIVIYGNVQSTIEDNLNDKVVKLVQHNAIVGIIKDS